MKGPRLVRWSIRPSLHAYDLPVVDLVELAVEADRRGFDTLWLGEHIVAPARVASVHPGRSAQTTVAHNPLLVPGAHLSELWVNVGAVAASTRRLTIATGICIAPLRHPLVIAQAAATACRLSKGRFLLGLGAGWLAEEFAALGADFGSRGALLDETIDVLRRAFAAGMFSHRGKDIEFDELWVTEDRLDIPIIVGGNSARALRRAATADGWFSSGTPRLDDARVLRDEILRLRGSSDTAFRCSIRVESLTSEAVARSVEHGFDDLVFHVDQHVAARAGGWRPWLDEVEDVLTNHRLEPVASTNR